MSTSGPGYVCPNCQLWVNSGETHTCWRGGNSGGYQYQPMSIDQVHNLAVEQKLDRIIELLEVIQKQMPAERWSGGLFLRHPRPGRAAGRP